MSRPFEEGQPFRSLVFVRSPLHDQQIAVPPENQRTERLVSISARPSEIVFNVRGAHDPIAGIEVDRAISPVNFRPVETRGSTAPSNDCVAAREIHTDGRASGNGRSITSRFRADDVRRFRVADEVARLVRFEARCSSL